MCCFQRNGHGVVTVRFDRKIYTAVELHSYRITGVRDISSLILQATVLGLGEFVLSYLSLIW